MSENRENGLDSDAIRAVSESRRLKTPLWTQFGRELNRIFSYEIEQKMSSPARSG
jgi:hypothetical protein